MTERRAFFLVCDDLLMALNGKITIVGAYSNDIIIASDPFTIGQLVFWFQIETPIAKPLQTLELQVSLPGDETPRRLDVPQSILSPISAAAGRTKITYRWPFLLAPVQLRPGPIELKLIHEEGVMDVGVQWVVTVAQVQASQGGLA